jgi:hypothetical protein
MSVKVIVTAMSPTVTYISARGFWLLIHDREFFVGFAEHPWFRDATVTNILNVRLLHGHHLYWPGLDVDLEIESLEKPEKYTLVYE